MDAKLFSRRLLVIGLFFAGCLLCYLGVLFDAQVVHGAENLEKSVSTITRSETVSASRGIVTDRNGKSLVSNQLVYTLSFDSSAFSDSVEMNEAILRLLRLLESYGVSWVDTLPLDAAGTHYTVDTLSPTYLNRFSEYLLDRKFIDEALTEGSPVPAGLSAARLLAAMRKDFKIPDGMSAEDARKVLGVRYELALRRLINMNDYVMTEELSVELISELNDGNYLGAKVGTSSVRRYETDYAAHILGTVGVIWKEEYAELKEKGYSMDAVVGKSGVEKAFEEYLHGKDGRRIITTNDAGKITSEVYTKEPEPGSTVALTIDIDFQAQVEQILAAHTEAITEEDGIGRGAAAAVVGVGTGEVLALASYPTYQLATYHEDYSELSQQEVSPYYNRATSGTYAPGSTFKPITATAALENNVITTRTTIKDEGIYKYYAPSYQPRCWVFRYGRTHGKVNVTAAITESCNYFFYEVGRLTGISTISDYASQFGLGSSTGIEIGDAAGTLASPLTAEKLGQVWYDGQTLAAAIGQSYTETTPLQLANYIATLVGGGDHYAAHLLKSVKSYDGSTVEEVYDEGPLNTVRISETNLKAIMDGMHDLTTTGSLAGQFSGCVVEAGAKTGTAQIGSEKTNSVFVCYAPYDDPEIAIAIVIEKGGSGSASALAAVEMLNAYFSDPLAGNAVTGENTLLP